MKIMKYIFIFLAINFIVIFLFKYNFFKFYDFAVRDYFVRLSTNKNSVNDRIVIISVNEKDIQWIYKNRNSSWPMNDGILSELFEKIDSASPSIIGFDFYRDQKINPGSNRLINLFKNSDYSPYVVFIRKIGDKQSITIDPPMHLNYELVGFNDVIVDFDGVLRRNIIFLQHEKKIYSSFSFTIMNAVLPENIEIKQLSDSKIKIGKSVIKKLNKGDAGYKDIKGFQIITDYNYNENKFKMISAKDILSGKADLNLLKDKIVLIGPCARSLNDLFYYPYFSGGNRDKDAKKKLPGVVYHAIMLENLLDFALKEKKQISYLHEKQELMWIILAGILGFTLSVILGPSLLFVVLLILFSFLIFCFSYYLFFSLKIIIHVIPALTSFVLTSIGIVLYISRSEKNQKEVLMQLFSKHVSKDIADDLWNRRDEFMNGNLPEAKRITASVLFSDIKGFTTISESLPPDDLLNWINSYMERMSQVISEHKGVIDKFIGDAIMAEFGVPIERTKESEIKSDAINSVKCALGMKSSLIELNKENKKNSIPELKMRVGIYTGPLVAGSLGSKTRMEYTVLGDTVNTASRLESYDKTIEAHDVCRILIGESTYEYVKDYFNFEKIGSVKLKGKNKNINIFYVKSEKK